MLRADAVNGSQLTSFIDFAVSKLVKLLGIMLGWSAA